ncbi:MAG: molybdenum cofactor guanylyltransferase MobA [Proteobacteria bacterium]|nr:molybdenum cofactor guanylyltransferase MobA [Pseudomonadota bacterium]MCH8187750.1 molybdenum cofactor guanylyltransferase MobA [Pseudomonadota bacterium]
MTAAVGVLLAGGRARRMGGGDKCLRSLGGETLLARAVARAEPQVGTLVLNANGDPSRFAGYGLPVIHDVVEGFAGPLAGVLSGLEWAATERPDVAYVATMPTDAPFFPGDLVGRLADALRRDGAELACAASAGRSHPVFGLWPVRLKDDLRAALVGEGLRKIDVWTARHRLVTVEFAVGAIDPFFNVNTPEDLAEAEIHLKRSAA